MDLNRNQSMDAAASDAVNGSDESPEEKIREEKMRASVHELHSCVRCGSPLDSLERPLPPPSYDGFHNPKIAVDVVMLRFNEKDLQVLLVKRGKPPYKGVWALPGGYVGYGEKLFPAAIRELHEETGVKARADMALYVGVFDSPDRNPDHHVVTHAYILAPVDRKVTPVAGDDAADARWFNLDVFQSAEPLRLAFDHAWILATAMERHRSKIGTIRTRCHRCRGHWCICYPS